MAGNISATFSESWYRVANQRLSLRPGVKVRRQNYRGERWVVIENPFNNQHFRVRPAAYEFIARLRSDRTVEEVWQQCLDRFPDDAPGQEAVIQLLSQLYFAGLLQYDLAADSAQLFERYQKRRQQEIGSRFLNIMFMRFPLLDPDRFLVRTLPFVGKFLGVFGAVLWFVVVGFGVKVVVDNFAALKVQTQAALAPDNIALLYLGLILIKTLHEFGHAYFCRKFGGEVHVMGVMLMIFTPVPYVDATSSWGIRSRWKRALVGAAGMIVEVFFAAIAAFIWAKTGTGTLHSLAYNIMLVASVSTVIFNINPLLRFDGYYILSDLLDVPNLHQQATAQLRHLAERYLFGLMKSESPAQSRREAFWLTFFGIASGIYRIVVFSGILFAIADRFLIIGLIMAAVCLISWVTVPIWKFISYLASSPKLERQRFRAVVVSSALAAVVLLALQVIPFPNHFRASGVVRAKERTELACEVAGRFQKVLTKPGSRVQKGQPLVQLQSRDLELEIAQTQARFDELDARVLKAMKNETADIKPLLESRDAIGDRLKKLRADEANLTVKALHEGIWVAPGIEDFVGRWMSRGSNLGLVVNPDSFEFAATVLQEDADALFTREISGAEVRLKDDASRSLKVASWSVIPGEQKVLPSAALGWRAGGDVAVEQDDEHGSKAVEPFFKVIGKLDAPAGEPLFDGCSGKIRFDLPSEPLLPRWFRRLWQLLQKRYQV